MTPDGEPDPEELARDRAAVARVEQILEAAANPAVTALFNRTPPAEVTHSLWLCNCYSDDDDAPVWQIIVTDDGIGWRRDPLDASSRDEPLAHRFLAGGHVFPWQVLGWLEGQVPHDGGWFNQDVEGDPEVLDELTRRLHPS